MKTAWYRTADPVDLPMSLADVKLNRRIESNEDDVSMERRLRAAVEYAESRMARGLLTQTWTYYQDYFTDEWQLPMAAPLQEVSSVKYYDTSGNQQTLSPSVYHVNTLSEPACITRAPNQAWPSVQWSRPLAVETTYVVGWEDPALIPQMILEALLLFIGDRDEHRENTVIGTGYTVQVMPFGMDALLAPHVRDWRPPVC